MGCAWHWTLTCVVFLQIWPDADALRPRVPALELVSAVAGMTGRDAVGQGQGVRAGDPVGAHESRCSGTPLLTCKRFA